MAAPNWDNWAEECRSIRTALGMTQMEFGEKLGVTNICVYLWESGRRKKPSNRLTLAAIERLRKQADQVRRKGGEDT